MNYKWLLFFILTININAQEKEIKKENLPVDILNVFFTEALSLNHIGYFLNEEEKQNGMSIVINESIKPYYKKLSLKMFNKEIKFKNHKELYKANDPFFLEFIELNQKEDIIHLIYAFRKEKYIVDAKFKKKEDQWILETKNLLHKPKAIYNIRRTKEHCLLYAILYPDKIIDKCLEYDFFY
ncbi:hypothetical protein [Aquimarina rhabdastrellae]